MNLQEFTNTLIDKQEKITSLGNENLEKQYTYYFNTDIKHDRYLSEHIRNIIDSIKNNIDIKELYNLAYTLKDYINAELYYCTNNKVNNLDDILKLGIEAYLQEFHNKNYTKLLYNYIITNIILEVNTTYDLLKLNLKQIYNKILYTNLTDLRNFNSYSDIEDYIKETIETNII